MNGEKTENLKEKTEHKKGKKPKKEDDKWKPSEEMQKVPASPRQCLGPCCVKAARPESKYCSDECGMNLAAARIRKILPQRIQEWQKDPCIAEEYNKKMLEHIECERQATHSHLKDMESRFHELEAIILRGKQQAMCKNEEHFKGENNRTDLKIFCVSCGKAISIHIALRHMERCFVKYECNSSFGSMYPTSIEGTTRLFCDFYNPQSKRYCKRLQVLCPEHSQDTKVIDDEVCGCPLVHNVFEVTGNFCRLPKRLCNYHYCWEKLRRAELDLERVRTLYKLEQLFEQEQKVRTAMANRAGLLSLMLHQTTQHDPLTSDLRSKADN